MCREYKQHQANTDMLITLVLFVAGLAILVAGAESLVRGSSALALRLGISPLVVGLTVVAFGTSSPELAVSVDSALRGSSSIALGNVIGSNIANIALILGVTALIQPLLVQRSLIVGQIPFMIAVSCLLWLLLLDNNLSFADGLLMFTGLIVYIYASYRSSRHQDPTESEEILPGDVTSLQSKVWFCIVLIVLGLAALVGGGMMLVDAAVELARIFNVDETIIGLTVVAFGTSMPELATSVVAALRKQADIALGNIVGSNIFNILSILGIASMITPLSSVGFSHIDFAVMVAFAVILLPMCMTRRKLDRMEGLILVAGYLAYLYYIWPEA